MNNKEKILSNNSKKKISLMLTETRKKIKEKNIFHTLLYSLLSPKKLLIWSNILLESFSQRDRRDGSLKILNISRNKLENILPLNKQTEKVVH